MNTQKISSIKIPTFDKANYTLWKKKMMPFIRMANPLYIQILKNGPFIPMVIVDESTDRDMVIPAHYAPKDPAEYTDLKKEKISLDSDLQLILIESFDNVMYNNIVNCDTTKQIWEKIEILCEGTEEVRLNQRRILISQYEGFMAKPKESITDVFERASLIWILNFEFHKFESSKTFSICISGIIGLTIAHEFLLESDLSVAVVDADVPCAGATSAGQGYIWMVHKTPRTSKWELATRSRHLWEEFVNTVTHQGLDPLHLLGWKKTGSLLVGKTAEESVVLKQRVDQLSKAGFKAQILSSTDLLVQEPALELDREGGASCLLDDYQLDARQTVAYIEKVI
ncbi:hypothetical protein AgCh_038062 [Apium graveolens]